MRAFLRLLGSGTFLAILLAPCITVAAGAAWQYHTVAGANGVPLNVVTAGDRARPPILLVHGIGQSHLSWENQLRAPLSDEFYVVAVDLRGHGQSGKPVDAASYGDYRLWAGDVQAIIAQLQLDRPVLVGWSYGTLVVADYLRVHGASGLRGIVLTGAYGGLTPPPPPPPADVAQRMLRLRDKQSSPNLQDNLAAAAESARLLTQRKLPEAYYARAAQISMMMPRDVRRWMFARSLANADLIPKITVPLLITIGGRDFSTPERQGRDLAALVPGARVSFYPGIGHSPFVEDAERYTRELADFARAATQPR